MAAMDSALSACVRDAHGVPDDEISVMLLSVAEGIDTALARSRGWDVDSICSTVALLGRMPDGAASMLVVSAFVAQTQWRDGFIDCEDFDCSQNDEVTVCN